MSAAGPNCHLVHYPLGRIYHAKGIERLVRNSLFAGRTPDRFYDPLEWLYGWTVDKCLA